MLIYSVIIISLIAIIYLVRYTFSQDKGTSQMQEISTYIKEGAMAFIKRQYKTIFVLSIVALFLIILSNYFGNASKGPSSAISISLHTGIAFITGAFCSALSGYIGMYMAVNSNVRAAAGAKKGLNNALQIALKGGAVTGLAVTSLSLLGVASLFLIYGGISGNDTLIKEAPLL